MIKGSVNKRSTTTHSSNVEELVLYICKGFSGEIVRVTIAAECVLEEAIPEIADQIRYFSPDWEKIGLYNLTRDFEYKSGSRFSDTKTENGDLIMMADGAACHKPG